MCDAILYCAYVKKANIIIIFICLFTNFDIYYFCKYLQMFKKKNKFEFSLKDILYLDIVYSLSRLDHRGA